LLGGKVSRTGKSSKGDTVVKLRPVIPKNLSSKLRQKGSFNVELDAMPGAFVCSGSLKGKANNADVKLTLVPRRRMGMDLELWALEKERDYFREVFGRELSTAAS